MIMEKNLQSKSDIQEFDNVAIDDSYEQLTKEARLKVARNEWDSAIRNYRNAELKRFQPSDSHIDNLFREATKAIKAQKHEESIEILCRLLAFNPVHSDSLKHLANILHSQQLFSGAEIFAKRYLEVKPHCPQGLNSYGAILGDLGRHSEANQIFETVIKLNPDSPAAHINLANEYHIRGDIDKSFTHSSRAIKACAGNGFLANPSHAFAESLSL